MVAESLESRLLRVQEDFVRGLPARIAEFLQVWDCDLPVPERLRRAHHHAHRLSGGAGTLGQPGLSAASKVLELEIQGLLDAGREPDGATLARFRQRTEALLTTLQAPA